MPVPRERGRAGRAHGGLPARLRRPDGTMPAIGDADGGWLLPLVAARADDSRGVFAVGGGAVRAGRTSRGPPEAAAPEVLWLLGADGLRALRRARAGASGRRRVAALSVGGYAVMRSGLGSRRAPADRRRRPARLPGEQRARPRRSAERPVRDLRRALPRGCRHLLLHAGTGVARLLPQHAPRTARCASTGSNQAEPAGPFRWQQRPAARARALALATRRSTCSTPSTTPTPGSPIR